MINFRAATPFSFNYPTFDFATGLFVAAKIYDVSTGTPSFVSTVAMAEITHGFYSGNFSGVAGKTYLAIMAVYTDGTYTTLITSRAPNAECYKEVTAPVTFGVFNYGVFNQNPGLFIAGNVYDVSTGTPVLVTQAHAAHVFAGVYFGFFTGVANDSYEIPKFVYTDGTYTTTDPSYGPGSDTFQLTSGGGGGNVTNIFQGSPSLVGKQFNGQLQGQQLQATLVESIA